MNCVSAAGEMMPPTGLALQAVALSHVYVARVAMGADPYSARCTPLAKRTRPGTLLVARLDVDVRDPTREGRNPPSAPWEARAVIARLATLGARGLHS